MIVKVNELLLLFVRQMKRNSQVPEISGDASKSPLVRSGTTLKREKQLSREKPFYVYYMTRFLVMYIYIYWVK